MDVIDEGQSMHERSNESNHDKVEKESDNTGQKESDNTGQKEVQKPKNMIRTFRPAPLEILNNVKINNTLATPRSTIKNFLKVPQQTELRFTRENLRKVEEQLKGAFVEFYHKLRLLKSYNFLNTLAFSKIMKKYDKVYKSSLENPDFVSHNLYFNPQESLNFFPYSFCIILADYHKKCN
jgi:hypothetical protein